MVVRRGDPRVTRLVVKALRSMTTLTQEEFGEESQLSQSDVSRFESGFDVPSEAELKRMGKTADFEWPVVVHLLRVFTVLRSAADRLIQAGKQLEGAVLDAVLLATAPYLLEEDAATPEEPTLEEARQEEAAEIWTALETFPPLRRRELIEMGPPQARTCALVARVCEASVKAAAHLPAEALELADFACFLAERVEEGQGRRSRALGYAHAVRANARRVANEFGAADAPFRRAWKLWQAGVAADPDPLAEWRLLDLEASLRRVQRRPSEALDLLDRARSACGDDPVAIARILMNKSSVLEKEEDFAGALAVLEEAAPAIEVSGDPHLLFCLRFDRAANLRHLERSAEAAQWLEGVRDLARGNALCLIRVDWLEARLALDQGREDEALAALEQVQRDFTAHELPYEAALSSLDLAVLWLERGRTAEVRELALGMAWIFQAKGIAREALASLTLFCEAARQDAASVELARQVGLEIERIQRQGPALPAAG
ncbi:MAG TPA: helix-turn-helix transcriptional regulator [Thermoanaerobaculia bacterium]|nr:helix-turn-helix transcriptional regulator [Thermoanaerobaculia bacterium]